MDRQRRIAMVFVVLTIIFTFFGSTLAYWNWQTADSQKTNIVFKLEQDFWCAADGGGDITQDDVDIAPASCTNANHAIQREVTVTPTIHRNDLSITTELFLDINNMGTGFSNSDNFKYALTTNPNSCTEGVISSGTFKGTRAGDQVRILSQNYSSSTPQTYYLYIWLDAVETSPTTMRQQFSLSMSGDCFDEVELEAPVIDEGMIPVTLSSNGTVKTIQPGDPNWYDYDNKEWANVVLVNDDSRSTYQDTSGVTVNQSDILAYYVWIPRYRYRIPPVICSSIQGVNENDNPECYRYIVSDGDKANLIAATVQLALSKGVSNYTMGQATIEVENALQSGIFNSVANVWYTMPYVFELYTNLTGTSISYTTEYAPNNTYSGAREIDIEFESTASSMKMGDAINTYRTHPAFWWDDDGDGNIDSGETITGIWVGKFETSANTDSTCYTSSSNANCVASNISPRIVPNVKSLINQNVSTQFTTSQKFSASGNIYGLSNTSTNSHMMKNSEWGAVAYLSHSKYGINYEIRINNNSNYITGCGASVENGSPTSVCEISYNAASTPQSTTGNITGIYDMSGGTWEKVMGVLADANGNPRSGFSTGNNSGFNGMLYNDGVDTSYTSGLNFPASKYYDLYTLVMSKTASNGGLYGHALSETDNWYEDYPDFVYSDEPWFIRGGSYYNGARAGAWSSTGNGGGAGHSWRSVLVVGYGP